MNQVKGVLTIISALVSIVSVIQKMTASERSHT